MASFSCSVAYTISGQKQKKGAVTVSHSSINASKDDLRPLIKAKLESRYGKSVSVDVVYSTTAK